MFGEALQAELDGVEGKKKEQIQAKRLRILQKWIPEAAADSKNYRDPAKSLNL